LRRTSDERSDDTIGGIDFLEIACRGVPVSRRPRSEATSADGAAQRGSSDGSEANLQRRQEIVEAGTSLFFEKGYDSTTTREIGDAIGLLKGSLYYYINSKEDLLFEIIRDVHAEGQRRVAELRALDAPAMAKLRLAIERGVLFAANHVRELRIFFNDGRALSPERQASLRGQRNDYDMYLRELIVTAQKDGELCPDVDAHAVTTAVVGVINWTAYWYRASGDLDPERIAHEYADLLLNGLACDAKKHTPGHRRAVGSLLDTVPKPRTRRAAR
jgi:AcrR family transcriptional regulator